MDQDNGEVGNQQELKALAAAARITNTIERLSELEKQLDMKHFIRFVAMEMLVGHWDGYAMQRSNYRIYQNPQSGKMNFISHGMDQTFREPDKSIWPPTNSLLVHAILQTHEAHQIYLNELTSLATNLFQTNRLSARLDDLANDLRPELTARGTNALPEWNRAFTAYRTRVLRRAHAIHTQLATNSIRVD